MKELDEMEKINAKLSSAVEEVTLEHCKKNEVGLCKSYFILSFSIFWVLFTKNLIMLFGQSLQKVSLCQSDMLCYIIV